MTKRREQVSDEAWRKGIDDLEAVFLRLLGDMIVRPGQWIVRDDAGLYSLDDRAFCHAYEPVEEARDDG